MTTSKLVAISFEYYMPSNQVRNVNSENILVLIVSAPKKHFFFCIEAKCVTVSICCSCLSDTQLIKSFAYPTTYRDQCKRSNVSEYNLSDAYPLLVCAGRNPYDMYSVQITKGCGERWQ